MTTVASELLTLETQIVRFLSVVSALVAALLCACSNSGLVTVSQPGRQIIKSFKLQDLGGAQYDSEIWRNNRCTVVAFLGTECPLARQYGPRLAELAARYERQNVAFVAIDSNEQDNLAKMASFARESNIRFPFLKDPANQIADAFGAERTPEVFVVDRTQVVVYHGRIDDQYGVGYRQSAPKNRELSTALDEILSGKPVSRPVTPATGCYIGRVSRREPRGEITYYREIAPIIQKHCVECHRPGQIGPFSMLAFDDVKSWSSTIREVIEERRMPPWGAESAPGLLANDRRLSDREKSLLIDWIDNGMPEGDRSDLLEPPKFVEGWNIPPPDVVLEMSEPFKIPARGVVDYQTFLIKESFDQERWVVAAECKPGNPSVVHHLSLFYVAPGDLTERALAEGALTHMVAGHGPGSVGWHATAGTARRIPAGSRLYLQCHYTPNGVEASDRSRIGLKFANREQIAKELLADGAINGSFQIPPGAQNFPLSADYTFQKDMRIVSLTPHMHLRGKAFRFESIDPRGNRRLLLDVPRYDFGFQSSYVLNQPVLMPAGSKLHCSAWFDNSSDNPRNPDPTQSVRVGPQSWDEMLLGLFEGYIDGQISRTESLGRWSGR